MSKMFTQNRELSWLKFNERVLMEAADESVPLLERLKFISIFSSNLDEFFMIRVGSLFDLISAEPDAIDKKSNMTPRQQLDEIYEEIGSLYVKKEEIYFDVIEKLKDYGVHGLKFEELSNKEVAYVKEYFNENISPILSPQIIDAHHPFPHLQNKVPHIGVMLLYKEEKKLGIIPIPSSIPHTIFLPSADNRYIMVEDVLLRYVDKVFSIQKILEKTIFCITRNADIVPTNELGSVDLDFKIRMKTMLKKRQRLGIVRLETVKVPGKTLKKRFCSAFGIEEYQIFVTDVPMKLDVAFQLETMVSESMNKFLTYKPFIPQMPPEIHEAEAMHKQIRRRDVVLSYPFESMEPFLRLVRESSVDENVISIKITIYRVAKKAKLVEYLCAAAENGKDVTVLIELRARFDEQNNIDWSDTLEEAGCKIIYGFEDYKVHSKICLITRREKSGIRYITQVGTGNYNEKTAKLYTDLSLITENYSIGRDANEFFKNMGIGNLEGEYGELLVAPISLRPRILEMIDEEMAKGENGYVRIKINSLTDMSIIKRFKEASCCGVKIDLIIRGICCLIPGLAGLTENIRVFNVVGRYLEHSRIYCFGRGDEERMYISSADFMTRNTERRIEVACPILGEETKEKVRKILDLAQMDNVKGRMLTSQGDYVTKPEGEIKIDSQKLLMKEAKAVTRERDEMAGHKKATLFKSRLGRWIRKAVKKG